MEKPLKISIVTASYNQGEFLERTISSVLSQGYANLEYIIIDGGSTDNSVEIIKKYAHHLAYWVSEKDDGMYDALNKGFARATGDVMGWLNSDDILLTGALFTVHEVFTTFPQVKWVTGMPVSIDERDRIISFQPVQAWSKIKIASGQYQWIQQESTYWRRELWEKSGARLDSSFSLAGDFELWARFFRYEKLFSVHIAMAGFRKRSQGQKSLEGIATYNQQVNAILKREQALLSGAEKRKVRIIRVTRALIDNLLPEKWKKRSAGVMRRLQEVTPVISRDRASNALIIQGETKRTT
ncbi:Glycosyltransferase involved in cell wall bisynthesis [Chryseolinea serpens]|uniref:Glycosyltransferase involved in cell wall bisynthesis n=1 Tax=Chryseolinea serpens TaxID=947013 RepID=A0A1M5KXZ8_9BACT|nr:glycosyltransferase family 2 protein [Chryseolinea serpens]SHG57627.1 Glycosyltransferase involved in cell wall bisynthesis [Chryseolinea serpens]